MSNKFSGIKTGLSRRNIKPSLSKKQLSKSKSQRHRSIDQTNTSSLTAFELRKEITSKQLQNDQICALTVSKNLIYIATKSGRLSIFEERTNQQLKNTSRSNIKSHIKHKKTMEYKKAKNIKQMAVNYDKNLMILVLNNGHYLCMDALNLIEYSDKKNNILPTNKTRNGEIIISNFRRPYYRFAICSKKNIYIFEWDKLNKNYLFVREISNGDLCISCLFFNHYLCFSTNKKGFIMHDIKTGKENKINVPSMPNNIPRMYKIGHHDDFKEYNDSGKDEGYLLVQASTNLSIFIDKTGNPAQKDTVNWSSTPLFVIDCKTYMVGYLDNKCIEIISLVDQKAVQLLKIYNNSYNVYNNNEEREINGLYKTKSNRVILYDGYDVFSLIPTPIQQQISECIKHLRIEKGLKLLMNDAVQPTQNELRSFQAEAGFALLSNLQWKRSMEYFGMSDVDPRDIIYLFPEIKFNGFDYTIQHPSAPKDCTIHDLINKVLKLKRSQMNVNVDNDSEEKRNEYLNGIYYLGHFLWKRRSEPSSEDFRIHNAETRLCVDTALLKIYVELIDNRYNLINQDLKNSAPFEIDDLLDYTTENACVESECEKILISSQQYYNLALFYRSKQKLKKSLNSLYKIGKTKEWKGNVDDAIDLTIKILSLMTDKKDLWTYSQWILELKPEDAMNIFTHSRRRRPNDKLYIHFDKVINHIHEDIINNMDGYSDIINFDYIQKYLEFIVAGDDGESLNPKYHDQLAYLYMKKISRLNKLRSNSEYNDLLENIREKLLQFLEKSQLISPSKLLQHAKNFQLYDEIIELNKKLKNHKAVLYTLVIDKKDHKCAIEYCKETAPHSKDRSDRFLELLRLYFGDRTDEQKEEKSDVNNFQNDSIDDIMTEPKHLKKPTINYELLKDEYNPENDELYMEMEKGSGGGMNFDFDELDDGNDDTMPSLDEDEMFQNTPNRTRRRGAISVGSTNETTIIKEMMVEEADAFNKEEFFDLGCDILYDYAFDMDYLKVLQLLPSNMDIMHFEQYIKKIVPYIVHKRRNTQIKKNLYKRQYMRQTTRLAKVQSMSINMDYASLCKKCNKNIGSSVFILDPKTMKKYHYSCFYRKRGPKNPNIITNQHHIDDLGNDIINDNDINRYDRQNNNIKLDVNINPNMGSLISNRNRNSAMTNTLSGSGRNTPIDIQPFNNPFANNEINDNINNMSSQSKRNVKQENNPFGNNNNATNPFGMNEQKKEVNANPFGIQNQNNNNNTNTNPFGNNTQNTNPFGDNVKKFEETNPFSSH